MNSNKGKVLLICPRFFGYEEKIHSKLNSLGFEVDLIVDTPTNNGVVKGLIRVFRPFFVRYLHQRFIDKLNQCHKGGEAYNKIIIVKGEYLTETSMEEIKVRYPTAELIYYNWDSIKNSPYSLSIVEGVNRAYTFDSYDAKKESRLSFLPLFFVDDYRANDPGCTNQEFKYDICFIGTARKGRFKSVNRLSKLDSKLSLYLYIYVQSKFKGLLNYFLIEEYKNIDQKHINSSPLSTSDVRNIFDSSKSVLDVQHPSQSGLTIRTFECLASKKKLITTNENIKKYDFYNDGNIFILKRGNEDGLYDFIQSPYVALDDDIVEQYSIDNWLYTLLGNPDEV